MNTFTAFPQIWQPSSDQTRAAFTAQVASAIKKGFRGFKDTTNYEFRMPHAKQTWKLRPR